MRIAPALLVIMLCAAGADAAPARVAVVPQVEVNVDAQRAEALGSTLADALRAKLDVDAIGGVDVTRRLPDGGIAPDCVAQPACITQIGTRLEADQILFLVIVQVGHTIQLDATWADVATGKTIARPMIELPDDARAAPIFGDAAPKLLPDAPLRPVATSQTVVIHEHADTITTPRHMTTTSWITGGVAVAALGGAIALGAVTRDAYDACNHPDMACTNDRIDAIKTRSRLGDASLVLGVAAGVATAVLYWQSGGETIAVTPTPGGAAVSLGGRF
jgi:hypothetical protein